MVARKNHVSPILSFLAVAAVALIATACVADAEYSEQSFGVIGGEEVSTGSTLVRTQAECEVRVEVWLPLTFYYDYCSCDEVTSSCTDDACKACQHTSTESCAGKRIATRSLVVPTAACKASSVTACQEYCADNCASDCAAGVVTGGE